MNRLLEINRELESIPDPRQSTFPPFYANSLQGQESYTSRESWTLIRTTG